MEEGLGLKICLLVAQWAQVVAAAGGVVRHPEAVSGHDLTFTGHRRGPLRDRPHPHQGDSEAQEVDMRFVREILEIQCQDQSLPQGGAMVADGAMTATSELEAEVAATTATPIAVDRAATAAVTGVDKTQLFSEGGNLYALPGAMRWQ